LKLQEITKNQKIFFQRKINMKYIDIHCHLDFPDYSTEFAEVLERMKEKEVGAITIGTDLESSKKAVKIAENNENIWACIGIHPDEAVSVPSPEQGEGYAKRGVGFSEEVFGTLVQSPKVVAIGECGLDYFRLDKDPAFAELQRGKQKKLFIQQIEFALRHNKPLMLHCRNSYDDVLDILERYENLRGNAHFFAGNIEQAKRFLDLGFTMSFTGVITFTHDYDEVIKFLPISSIMSETDAPFVAPVPHRGKRNEPGYVVEVVKKMAEIRGENEEFLQLEILKNAKRVFGLPN